MLGHLIYNYEYLDDVRIQAEISKASYSQAFGGTYLVHVYNGDKAYQPHLEDRFIEIRNRGHFKGAIDAINVGLTHFTEHRIPELKYVLVTAADTWLLNIDLLKQIICEMHKDGKVLAASSWIGQNSQLITGFSTDLFIIDIEWNRQSRLFPLNYDRFARKFRDLFALRDIDPLIEVAVQYAYGKYFIKKYDKREMVIKKAELFRRIVEREPIHDSEGKRFVNWPTLGIYTDPHPDDKREILKEMKADFGQYCSKLVNSECVEYYNQA